MSADHSQLIGLRSSAMHYARTLLEQVRDDDTKAARDTIDNSLLPILDLIASAEERIECRESAA